MRPERRRADQFAFAAGVEWLPDDHGHIRSQDPCEHTVNIEAGSYTLPWQDCRRDMTSRESGDDFGHDDSRKRVYDTKSRHRSGMACCR